MSRERQPSQEPAVKPMSGRGFDRVLDFTKQHVTRERDNSQLVRVLDKRVPEKRYGIGHAGWGKRPMFRVPTAVQDWWKERKRDTKRKMRRTMYKAYIWLDERFQ